MSRNAKLGTQLEKVYPIENWDLLHPSHLGDAPVKLPSLGHSRVLRCPPGRPPGSDWVLAGEASLADSLQPLPSSLGSAQPLELPRLAGQRSTGEKRKRSGSQARVLSASVFDSVFPASSSLAPQLSLQDLGRAVHPSCPGVSKFPPRPDAAPLPTGLPSGPLGAASTARRCCLAGEQEPPGSPGLRF